MRHFAGGWGGGVGVSLSVGLWLSSSSYQLCLPWLLGVQCLFVRVCVCVCVCVHLLRYQGTWSRSYKKCSAETYILSG